MPKHPLPILALLPFFAAATVFAQSAPAKSPAPTPQFDATAAPHDSRIDLPPITAAKAALRQQALKLASKTDSVCYTVRSYQYTADAAAPKPSGQTTCSPARSTSALVVVQPKQP